MKHYYKYFLLPALFLFFACGTDGEAQNVKVSGDKDEMNCYYPGENGENMAENNKNSVQNDEWKDKLTPEQYRILREKGTERPFTGKYYHFDEEGVYRCAACGEILFESDTKYNSGSGWPSFYAPADKNNVGEKEDNSFAMQRTEVICNNCKSHLGHVFEDGPQPTGMRYCINSAALKFEKKEEEEK